MTFLLFDRDERYIGNLKNVLSARHPEELNGENVLELTTLDEVEKLQRILYKDEYGNWHEFIVRGVDESKVDKGIERIIFAEHSFYETLGDYVEDKRAYNTTANIALERALETTRWEVGIVDDLGIGSTNFYHISAKEAVQKVAETWQGELRYRIEVSGNRITGRYVDLLARRGYDLGKRFTYTKDLISITKTVHRDDVITALYGYGKGQEIADEEGQPTGGYGRRITFGEINGGKNYVENLEAKEIWGRLNPDDTRSHVFGKVEFDDVEDPEELLALTTAKLEELSQPLLTYQATVIDLKAFGIEHEGVALGDTVGIIDNEFEPELRLKARVIKITRDLLEPENNEIILGNFIPSITDTWLEQEKFISNFRGKQGVWDRSKIINDDGTIDSQFLKNLVDELNTRMNALGGYVYLSEDGKGLITYDKPIDQNPTMAIQILGGSFRIANSKLPNGDWDWRTFGDGNGFVADSFVGGLLKGGKVNFDLTNGTLLLGNNIEDYSMYFDGTNLLLGSDVTLSWANIDDKPNIPTVPNYITSTKITQTTIESPDIIGGTITGGDVYLRNNSGNINAGMSSSGTATTSIRMWAGSTYANRESAPFRVQQNGKMIATNADINGKITSDTGQIGIFEIKPGEIQARDTVGSTRWELRIGAPIAPEAGGGKSPFVLSNDGFMKAMIYSDGRIQGSRLISNDIMPSNYGGTIGASTSSRTRFDYIYLNNQPNVGSDVRQKNSIQDIPEGLIEKLKDLEPKMFKQNDAEDELWHFGYIAQDVERVLYQFALEEVGYEDAQEYVKDFAFIHKDESYLSLLYGEIAVLREKEMRDRIANLELQIEELKGV